MFHFMNLLKILIKTIQKNEKISLLDFMWKTAYADGKLDVDEERID